ncbi:MAG: hypothetical protein A2219_01840 [Elusimicrobia bacterium RIFOXYA2_FULL_50_26]|nr:MAG: hypothetical protein A2219_01840 [Elusimicrobia bacterium RIFOXYA2_FULL_50_26]
MIYFLLPAYNEENDLPRLLEEFISVHFSFPYHIIIVNDGSTDKTPAIIEEYKNKLSLSAVHHDKNRGLGKALSTGFSEILARIKDSDILITTDSDGTHPLDTVYAIINKIKTGADVVVASRFVSGGQENGVNLFRRLLSHVASSGLGILWPVENIRDYSSGFRGYSYAMITRLHAMFGEKLVEESGFSSTLELLLKASLAGGKFDEVPLKLRYDNKKGASKMKVTRTILAYFKLIVRLKRLKPAK